MQSNGMPRDARFATLSQGVYSKQYPDGFGLPILSTHLLEFTSQADAAVQVRHKIVTQYMREAELKGPMRAISSSYANVMVLVEGEEGEGFFGIRKPDEETHGASCSVPVYRDNQYAIVSAYDNTSGREQDAMAVMYLGLHDKTFDPSLIDDPEARAARAAGYLQENANELRQALQDDPEDAVSHAQLALVLFKQQEHHQASYHLRTAIRLNPNEPTYRSALATIEETMNPQTGH